MSNWYANLALKLALLLYITNILVVELFNKTVY